MVTKALSPYKIFIMRPHIATFNGSHNSVKSKVLLVLYFRKIDQGDDSGMTLRELFNETGCNILSLYAHVGEYAYKYRDPYLNRTMSMNSAQMLWHYTIAQRGIRFVEQRLTSDARARFLAEIKAYREGKCKA